MTKYRIHLFHEVRKAYEIEADSVAEAVEKVVNGWWGMDCVEAEDTGDLADIVGVDPLLDDGEADYDNATFIHIP